MIRSDLIRLPRLDSIILFKKVENSYVNMQHTPKPDKQSKVSGLMPKGIKNCHKLLNEY